MEELKFDVTDQRRAQQASQDKEAHLKELTKQVSQLKAQLKQASVMQQEKQNTEEIEALRGEIAKLKVRSWVYVYYCWDNVLQTLLLSFTGSLLKDAQ